MISKSGQSPSPRRSCDEDFEFVRFDRPAVAVHLDFSEYVAEVRPHRHRQGQLVIALHGAVTCKAADAFWIVPPDCGVWIPGGVDHSNHATSNARLAYFFVEPEAAMLPSECCTLSLSPMLREMILRLAHQPQVNMPDDHLGRMERVLLDELSMMPQGGLMLPIGAHPKIDALAKALSADPADRRTLGEWASHLAVSERSLTRMNVRETGLSFGAWRRRLHLVIALRQLAGGATVQTVSGKLGYE